MVQNWHRDEGIVQKVEQKDKEKTEKLREFEIWSKRFNIQIIEILEKENK